jgi:predicted amidohydrolase
MQDINVTIVQADLLWEDVNGNLDHMDALLTGLQPNETDVVILPEMFNSGFTMNPAVVAESPLGHTYEWMLQTAYRLQALMIGSFVVQESGKYYNRLHAVAPEGLSATYDKKHLFRMGKENEYYSAGSQKTIITFRDWRILPLICYDLRFPIWSRNRIQDDARRYDLLIYVANWPQRRAAHWHRLLLARAIENQAYVAGVNRVGTDGKGISHVGPSLVADFGGDTLIYTENTEAVLTTRLSGAKLVQYRTDFPAWQDADGF